MQIVRAYPTTAFGPLIYRLDNASEAQHAVKMITKYLTEVTTKFNPFSPCAKPARLFLTLLPPNARANGTSIATTMLPRNSPEPSSVQVKFKDGKQMMFDCQKYNIQGLVEEVDRHSRALQKAADLED